MQMMTIFLLFQAEMVVMEFQEAQVKIQYIYMQAILDDHFNISTKDM